MKARDAGPMNMQRNSRCALRVVMSLSIVLLLGSWGLAAPSQDDVLRSISDNVGASVDPMKLLAVVLGMAALVLLAVLLSQWRRRSVVPRTLNHPGKLLREVARKVNLKPGELRQIKLLAEPHDLSSPLLLLLCPSVMEKIRRSGKGKR